MISRVIQGKIERCLFKKKAIVVYGARQVGKTSLIQSLQEKLGDANCSYLNCDEPDVRDSLTNISSTHLRALVGKKKVVFIDEAQRVKNIGLTLKLFVDNFRDKQVVATGSSSFDLSNQIAEPLTGRTYEFHLHPFSLAELSQRYSTLEIQRLLERRIIFGMYPEIEQRPDEAEKLLKSLAGSYLYKDVLQFQSIKRPELLDKLLTALALQIGNEVSFNELATMLSVNKETISNYIQLLEKSFVVFRLSPFSRNLRNELTKLRKVYFYDTGIRNAILNNFSPLEKRNDVGALWENFMVSERMKYNTNSDVNVNTYFWRTHQQQEIDYLEERGGKIAAFEFKWRNSRKKAPRLFLETYPGSNVTFVDRENYAEFAGLAQQ